MTEPLRAGIYCRLSLSRDGDTTKVDDQARICRELCEHRGWEVAEVYQDNSLSAWKRGVRRPGWEAMLADVNAGKLTAIVVYHGDRLVRQPFDLETLINLAYGRGIKLASPTGTRDLSDEDDLFILRIEVASQCRDSASTSRRMKMGIARRQREGLVNTGGRGGRLFGFATGGIAWFPPDRCFVATRTELVEADIVREVFARVLAGDSVRGLAADLRDRGVTTTAGKPMHPLAIRRMISCPRYAGLMPDGVSAGTWQPIVDRDDWEAANAALDGRGVPLGPGHTARRYLLSGIARCGACSAPLQALPAYTSKWTGKPVRVAATYSCIQPGCRKVTRSVALLDAYVAAAVVGRLAKKANPEGRLPSVPGLAVEWRALADERAEVEGLAADPAKGRHVHILLARLDSLDARIGELRELARGDADARLRGRHAGITLERFLAEPLGTRRALVSACLEVVVLPASRRGPGFRTEDVRLVPRVSGHRTPGQPGDHVGRADAEDDRGDDLDDPQVTRPSSAGRLAVPDGDAGLLA